jgi:hypothetical protein
MAGTLTLTTLSDGTNSTSATNCIQGSAKAWVNWGYVSSTTTVRASYNVSSVTRSGNSTYVINLTNAMPDANYAINYSISNDNAGSWGPGGSFKPAINSSFITAGLVAPTTTAFTVTANWSDSGRPDATYQSVSIFR